MNPGTPRRPRPPRRAGQALVEFALTLPVLLALLMGTIEVSRLLNIYVTANRICSHASLELAEPDITSSRSPVAGVAAVRRLLRERGNPDAWNQAYAPTIMAMQRAAPATSYVTVDVNQDRDGRLFSQVTMVIDLPPLMIPTAQVGGRTFGRLTLTARGLAMNEMQAPRRDSRGTYPSVRFPLSTVLDHPRDPLPELPRTRR